LAADLAEAVNVQELFGKLTIFGLSTVVAVSLLIVAIFIQQRLLAFYADKPSKQHHRQLIVLCLYLVFIVLAVILMPVGDAMRGQLLGFLGILLSATIALSSTTIVGNAVAGFMLNTLRNFRPGDVISIESHFGRVTTMDLLHVEIQTEDRDLITLPNLYLVTHPVRVLRSSGTILHVEVSLGYDVPRKKVEKALLQAAEETGLESPYVQIRHLGDFSVSYQVSGLMPEIDKLLSTRRLLRANTLDALHAADIEIVSPAYMTTRALNSSDRVMPRGMVSNAPDESYPSPDEVVFDKAKRAEELSLLKHEYTEMSQELIGIEQELKDAGPGDERRPITLRKKALEAKMARVEKQIADIDALLSG
jgi:small-conductance mechanosensitive channel